jgi:acyl-CoA thioesterase-2
VLAPAPGGGSTGPNLEIPGYRRLFGGQLLAQGLVAGLGAAPGFAARSLHMVFLAEGRPGAPVAWTTELVRSGRTFATVRVDGEQAGRHLATALLSLHVPEHGFEHAAAAPAVAAPEGLRTVEPSGAMPCEMRVDGDVRLDGSALGPPELAVWMRPPRLPAPPAPVPGVHEALLAWCSDATMMVTALRPHGVPIVSPALAATSVTSHTVSFHRPFAFDSWMLFAQQSPAAAGGRAYVRGDWFAGGLLVASCAQEVLIRPAPAGAT